MPRPSMSDDLTGRRNKAIYFLPERILVIDGAMVAYVDYAGVGIVAEHLEYVEPEGRLYEDSLVIDKRWRFINRDGSRDKRFKDNVELPVVRCGVMKINVAETRIELMTTNPQTPERFKDKF